MSANTNDPVIASPADYDRTIASVVAAFLTDPFIRWMFPDSQQYFHVFPRLMKPFVGRAFEHGSAYRLPDFRAAAMWLPPGVEADGDAMGKVMDEAIPAARRSEFFAVLKQFGEVHPTEPHWFLPVIAVEPLSQRRGLGATLMAAGLARCDETHMPAYLEATNPSAIPLYERFGFEAIGRIQAGPSPTVTPMWRAAR